MNLENFTVRSLIVLLGAANLLGCSGTPALETAQGAALCTDRAAAADAAALLDDYLMRKDEVAPLSLAVLCGEEADVAALLDQGADPYTKDRTGWAAVHYAGRSPNVAVLRAMTARNVTFDVAPTTQVYNPLTLALEYAVEGGGWSNYNYILETGVSLEARSGRTNSTIAESAVKLSQYEKAIAILDMGYCMDFARLRELSEYSLVGGRQNLYRDQLIGRLDRSIAQGICV